MSRLLDSLLESVRPAVLNRRSILLLLEENWHLRRDAYWSRLFRAMRPGVSAISQTPFAESLIRLATRKDDLLPLTSAIADPTHSTARRAYRFVVQFAAAAPDVVAPEPWLQLCLDASTNETQEVLAVAANLVYRTISRFRLKPELRGKAAEAARALLSSAWNQGLGPMALVAVIDTLDAAPVEGSNVLRQLIDAPAAYPHREEARSLLARHVEQLLEVPHIVARLYKSTVVEEADEETRRKVEFSRWYEAANTARQKGDDIPPVPSRIIARDRRSDFWLVKHVETFLKRTPLVGVRVCSEAVAYWEQATDVRDQPLQKVTLASAHGAFSIDARPSNGRHRHSTFLIEHMLGALGPAIDASPPAPREGALHELATLPAPSSVWAALIQHAEVSETFLVELTPLISDRSALRLFSKPIADLIRKLGDRLPSSLRLSIEESVASMNDESDEHIKSILENALHVTRTRHVDTPREDADDDEAILVDSASADDALDMRRFQLSREQLTQPANATIRTAMKAAWREIFRLEALRQEPKDVVSVLPETVHALGTLRAALRERDIAPTVETAGWSAFARLASLRVVLSRSSDDDTDVYESATRTDGRADPNGDLLNEGQAFPRAESVVGLIALALRHEQQAMIELDRLAGDREPAVRYQIAWRLRDLTELGRDRVWPLLVRLVGDNDVNVAAAAVGELSAFYKLDQTAALDLAIGALARFTGPTKADQEGRTDALMQLAWYYLARANDVASKAVSQAIQEIPAHPVGFDRLMHSYREWLVMADDDGAEEAVRLRTVGLFTEIGRACIAALSSVVGLRTTDRESAERDAHMKLVEDVANQLYFASGAFRAEESVAPLSVAVTSRFYVEMRDLLLEVGTCGVIPASNRVLETFEYFLGKAIANIDKGDALQRFLRVGEHAVQAGAADSYWLLDSIEKVLRRCVAERDPSLTDDATLVAWSRILDPLIDLGWEQAYRLARELDLSR